MYTLWEDMKTLKFYPNNARDLISESDIILKFC